MNGFIAAFLIAVFVTPYVGIIARKAHFVDDPKKRYHPAQVHSGIIPRAGGVGIYIAFLCVVLLWLPVSKIITGILLAATIVVLVGIWDDYKDLSPYFRLFMNVVVAGLVVGFGVGVPFITNPLGGIIPLDTWTIHFTLFGEHSLLVWADLFAVVWIVWMMNTIGWSAGVDGQLPGFVVIASIVIALLSQRFAAHDIEQTVVAQLAFVNAGAFMGFLVWNFYPQKIMPGYGGKSLAGFILAVLSILSSAKVGTALLVLGVPMIDAFYTLIRRMLSRKSPFRADRGHLHHHLLDLGWGKRRIALFYWGISALLGLIALNFTSQGKLFVFVLLGVLLGMILLALRLFRFFRVLP
ncbi:undecaprenyl/decaprenyl-phosphate alpha-N-acetylglucosaminyl 1-phosphate transferase [Candidatus Roizmanbacteria bacterium]|nr:undecaprenyl/decaprenyl-phosphate alpha-N-acetylglucosaminyl 1-phosphate transferase [Candidatus Roizmanbacteria bacterium]